MKLKTKFQDEDFDLGESTDVDITTMPDGCFKARAKAMRGGLHTFYYNTKADFDADWEDALEEQKKHYEILGIGVIIEREDNEDEIFRNQNQREIGNYFDTKEEAEAAVEKLKAFTRLKDKGFKFEGIKEDYTRILQGQNPFRTGKRYLQFNKSEDEEWMKENWKDLDTCFGGEE